MPTEVVFDINIYVNAIVGANSFYPLIEPVPPKSENPSADCLSLAFDGDHFALFASPHILENVARVLVQSFGVKTKTAEAYIELLLEIIAESGGAVIEPARKVFDVKDFEDNLVLDLVVASNALILVTADTDLTSLSPWNGRVLMRPQEFVNRQLQNLR